MPNDPTEREIEAILADATRCEGAPAETVTSGPMPPDAAVFPSGHPDAAVVHEGDAVARLRALLAAGVDAGANEGGSDAAG